MFLNNVEAFDTITYPSSPINVLIIIDIPTAKWSGIVPKEWNAIPEREELGKFCEVFNLVIIVFEGHIIKTKL